jgi:AraC-like DNA-binding protein
MNPSQDLGIAVSDYREFRPPPAVAEHLLCFWTQMVHPSSEFAQRVLPDCCVDIILMNGVPMVIGPWTESFVANLRPGTNILGARCHPGLASGLLGIPASELLNRSVPLCEIWGSADAARFARIADEATLLARMLAMEAALLRRLVDSRPIDYAIRAAIRWIAQHPKGRVEQLSEWLGTSGRQLQRRFLVSAGYGPKMFQSVLRFQRLLNEARRASTRRTLADLAAHAGYSDQAHMTREGQRLAGCSPATLLRSVSSTLNMSDLFKTGAPSTNYG